MPPTALTTGLRAWFETGAKLANQQSLALEIKRRFPLATHRTLAMVIVKPLPEIARDIPDWLKIHANGGFKDGAVAEDAFSLYIDPTTDAIEITDSWKVGEHTITFYIEENTCWALAARTESVYSAFMKGLPIQPVGGYAIRDMELLDELLQRFYEMMMEGGHDLASLAQGLM